MQREAERFYGFVNTASRILHVFTENGEYNDHISNKRPSRYGILPDEYASEEAIFSNVSIFCTQHTFLPLVHKRHAGIVKREEGEKVTESAYEKL